jgi:hypothetical protein
MLIASPDTAYCGLCGELFPYPLEGTGLKPDFIYIDEVTEVPEPKVVNLCDSCHKADRCEIRISGGRVSICAMKDWPLSDLKDRHEKVPDPVVVEPKCPYCGGENHKKCSGPEKAQEKWVEQAREMVKGMPYDDREAQEDHEQSDIRKELEEVIKMRFTPKCGWDDAMTCDEHGSCEHAQIIKKGLDEINRLRKFDEGKALTIRALEIAQDEFKKENETLRARVKELEEKLSTSNKCIDKYLESIVTDDDEGETFTQHIASEGIGDN